MEPRHEQEDAQHDHEQEAGVPGQQPGWPRQTVIVYASKHGDTSPRVPRDSPRDSPPSPAHQEAHDQLQVQDGPTARPPPPQGAAPVPAVPAVMKLQDKLTRKRWLLGVVKENFNEQMAKLVERFVCRSRHDKSVRRVPGVGRKVLVNLQDYWKRSSGQDKSMKTKDLLSVYSDSCMNWKDFQKWLTKELQFMPSCAKVTALSLDIYQKYWDTHQWVGTKALHGDQTT